MPRRIKKTKRNTATLVGLMMVLGLAGTNALGSGVSYFDNSSRDGMDQWSGRADVVTFFLTIVCHIDLYWAKHIEG